MFSRIIQGRPSLSVILNALVILMACLVGTVTNGQVFELLGEITVQNGSYSTGSKVYVEGAGVRAAFGKPTVSDAAGRFSLNFSGLPAGSSVRLTVNKPGYVVVNERTLEEVVIGRSDRLHIVMADAAELAERRAHLYGVAVRSVEEAHRMQMRALSDTMIGLSERLERFSRARDTTVQAIENAIAGLIRERDEALKGLDELVDELVSIDLDRSSGQYRRAYENLMRGHLDSVLLILDRTSLDLDLQQAHTQRKEGEAVISDAASALGQIVQSRQLRLNVFNTRLRFLDALTESQRIIEIVEQHPDVFDAHARIEAWGRSGDVLSAMGAYGKEVVLRVRIVERHRALLAGDTTGQCVVLDALAGALSMSGRLDSALIVSEEAVQCMLVARPSAVTEVAPMRITLGNVLRVQGRYKQAGVELELALGAYRSNPGSDSIQQSHALSSLGDLAYEQGDFTSAMDLYRQALLIRARTVGMEHPFSTRLLGDIGRTWHELGNYDSARSVLVRALQIERSSLGDEHPQLANRLGDLAGAEYSLAQYDSALVHLQWALEIEQRTLGIDHHATFSTRMNLAVVLNARGEFGRALPLLRAAVVGLRNSLGPDHADVGRCMGLTGFTFQQMGTYDSALVHFRRANAVLTKALGEAHPDVGVGHNNIGWALNALGETGPAIEEFRMAIGIGEKNFGPDHSDISVARVNIASLLGKQGDLPGAVKELRSAISGLDRQFGREHDYTGQALGTLGVFLEEQGDLDSAMVCMEEGLRVMYAVHGPLTIPTASAHEKLAAYHKRHGDPQKAEEHYRLAVAGMERNVPPGDPTLALYRFHFAKHLLTLNKQEEALPLSQQADSVLGGAGSALVLFRVYLALGRTEEGLEALAVQHRRCTEAATCVSRPTAQEIADARAQAVRLDRVDLLPYLPPAP